MSDNCTVKTLPSGVTIVEGWSTPEPAEAHIDLPGGCVDNITSDSRGTLIHIFLCGRRPPDCEATDFRRWIPAAINRLQEVIAQLEEIGRADQ